MLLTSMEKEELKKDSFDKNCQKCGTKIGGKAYYLIRMDCLYDGESVSACETVLLCSNCHASLKSWLNL